MEWWFEMIHVSKFEWNQPFWFANGLCEQKSYVEFYVVSVPGSTPMLLLLPFAFRPPLAPRHGGFVAGERGLDQQALNGADE